MARPIAQAISLDKFHGTDRSAKAAKLFHLEWFAIYSDYIDFFWSITEAVIDNITVDDAFFEVHKTS